MQLAASYPGPLLAATTLLLCTVGYYPISRLTTDVPVLREYLKVGKMGITNFGLFRNDSFCSNPVSAFRRRTQWKRWDDVDLVKF